MMNNSEMLQKLENIEKILIRDQVTTESLYLDFYNFTTVRFFNIF